MYLYLFIFCLFCVHIYITLYTRISTVIKYHPHTLVVDSIENMGDAHNSSGRFY